ncbi:hypothetical protein D3C81_1503770 [compost metagenome]
MVGNVLSSSTIGVFSASPYVAAVDENTIYLTLCSFITSSKFIVPYTLLLKYFNGSTILSPTREYAAKSITASISFSLKTLFKNSLSLKSPLYNLTPFTDFSWPVSKLSTTTTSFPCSKR